ncbi:hypothetical protein ACWEOE_26405 [Amycolatopsis sp. NPDC004368]
MTPEPDQPEPEPARNRHGEGEPPDGVDDAEDTGQQVIGEQRERRRD